jgi:hypoxanthine phosphoribosyltransferase
VHKLCQQAAPQILADFKPQLMIAIGGGGYVPARILRSFLKQPGSPNIPIQAIGLSLYEQLPDAADRAVEAPGTKVTRTQWLDLTALGEMANLVGRRVLIVDEVDDTRTTLEYAVKELQKDVEEARAKMGSDLKTEFAIFVLHVRPLVYSFIIYYFTSSFASHVLTRQPHPEQGQDEKGRPARRHHGRPVPGRPDGRRRVDLLPVGGHGH